MCGRFTLTTPGEALAEEFELQEAPTLEPRYNITPGTPIAVVGQRGDAHPRRLSHLHWGLPRPAGTGLLINVRAESLTRMQTTPHAWLARRCLVLADGFFEWQRTAGARQPYLFRRREGGLLAFAALWQPRPGAQPGAACALVTAPANADVAPIHSRMPVLVPRERRRAWLSGGVGPDELPALLTLLHPAPDALLTAVRVSAHVNDARHDDPGCLLPA
jgi:putative SOS response-associated peptidase YedK